jgi:hypothetical protein
VKTAATRVEARVGDRTETCTVVVHSVTVRATGPN